MTRATQGNVQMSAAAVMAVLLCVATALAHPGNQGGQPSGKGDQPQEKQAAGQGGMMGGQQGMGGMGMT